MSEMPRTMAAHEKQLREKRGSEFSLLRHVLDAVNVDALDLSKVAEEIETPRPTLERWLKDCGYRYCVQRRLEPIRPVKPGAVVDVAS